MKNEVLQPAAATVVVVNDDPTQLTVMSGLLHKAGLETRSYPGAEAALAALATAVPPALIVTDLYMPGIDGWRFCRLLRSPEYAAFNQVPILVVSATFAGEEASRIAAELGAEAFLPCPVDGRRFCAQVRAILGGERVRVPLRVLVVDDNVLLSDLLKTAFANHGYQVETALTLRAATAAMELAAFDVAVLDFHLPDGTGDNLLDTIRAQQPNCACVMMTSDPGPELALDLMKRGAAAYLQKPFQPDYLLELCARSRRERALLRVEELLEARTRELRASEERCWQLQKSESLGRLAGAIAHQFNNQLQAVMMGLEMAMDHLPHHAEALEQLTNAMKSAGKAAEVSSLLLTYLGQNRGKREPVALADLCQHSLPLLNAAMPGDIVLATDFPAPGPIVQANANEIQQVLNNLVTNAWEACEHGQGAIRLTVREVAAGDIAGANRFPMEWQPQGATYACLEVADTGVGIPDQDMGKIFDPFFSSKFAGRGMGLAVVLGIVRAQDGAITVESRLGRGSVFRVFLPMSTEALPPKLFPVGSNLKAPASGTVLVVEDEPTVRNAITHALTRLGFKVLAAQDGVEAVEMFRGHQERIHLVLCDLTMPRMGGWETLTALRQLAPGLPVILASGYDQAKVMEGDHLELPQAFLSKPFALAELRQALARALHVTQR
jgi:CheY-like chemotaxis protein